MEDLAVVRRGLDDAGVDYRWHVMDGAAHAFGRDVGPRWDPQATDEAFAQTVAFFRGALTA